MQVLIVEDNRSDRELLREMIEQRFQKEIKFKEASNLQTAISFLQRGGIDCVLLDLSLPDSTGTDTFSRISGRYPDVPVIIMSNNKDRSLAIDMVQRGAADYIIKGFVDEEEVFQRILLAIAKHKHTVRTTSTAAATVHRVERARANLQSAHESGEFQAIQATTAEATMANTDLSKTLFNEVARVSAKTEAVDREAKLMSNDVTRLRTELLEGAFDRPSLKSRTEHLERQVEQVLGGTKANNLLLDEVRLSLESLRTEVANLRKSEGKKDQLTAAHVDGRTKIVVAVLGLLSIIAGAAATSYFTNKAEPSPTQIKK